VERNGGGVGGGIWCRDLVEGYGGGIWCRDLVWGNKWWRDLEMVEALVKGFGVGK
jgi:hypothetical protein